MRQSYLKNAALLTGADVVLRLAGLGLRIWLANALGGEGMGHYAWNCFPGCVPVRLQSF